MIRSPVRNEDVPMLMLLGMVAFLALGALALLGAAALAIAVAMLFRPHWRPRGIIVLGSGAAGAGSSVLGFTLLQAALHADPSVATNAFALFAAAGFGAGAAIALLAIAVLGLFGRPTA
jgi:hypothetical protein